MLKECHALERGSPGGAQRGALEPVHLENGPCFLPARVAHFEVLEKQVEKNPTGAYECQRRQAGKEAAESTEELSGLDRVHDGRWKEVESWPGRGWIRALSATGSREEAPVVEGRVLRA